MRALRITIWTILALAMGAGGWLSLPEVRVNGWSVQAGRALVRDGLDRVDLYPPPEGHAREALWRGRIALARQDGAQAIAILTEGLHEYPQDALLHGWLGNAYEASGDVEKAAAEWREARAWDEMIRFLRDPSRTRGWGDALLVSRTASEGLPQEAAVYQAEALENGGNRGGAIALLGRSLAVWPQSRHRQEWFIILGNYLSLDKRWPDAVASYRQATEVPGGKYLWAAHIGLGRALYSAGRGMEEAEKEVRRGIVLNPERAEGYTALGDLLQGERRFEEANEAYAKADEKGTEDRWTTAKWVDSLLEANQPREALDVLERAIQKFPSEPQFYTQQLRAYKRVGDLDKAIASAQKSVTFARSGGAVAARKDLAQLYEQANRLPEAIVTYEDVLRLDDRDVGARVALGKALYRAGCGVDVAAAQFRRAIESEPSKPAGYFELGQMYQAEKRYSEAEEWYLRAVERSPDNPLPWVMRGENALLAGEPALAVRVLEQATERFPSSARAYAFLAEANRHAEDLPRALISIERAVSLAPAESAWYWALAGQLYESDSQQGKALRAYQTALALDVNHRLAREGLQRVQGELK